MPPKKKKAAAALLKNVRFEDENVPSIEASFSERFRGKSLVESVKHRREKKQAIASNVKVAKLEDAVSGPVSETVAVEMNKENKAENTAVEKLEQQPEPSNDEADVVATNGDAKNDKNGVSDKAVKPAAKRGGKRGAKKDEEPAPASEKDKEEKEEAAAAEVAKPKSEDGDAKSEKKPAARRGGKRGAKKVEEEEPENEDAAPEEQVKTEPEKTAKRGGRRAAKKPQEADAEEEEAADDAVEDKEVEAPAQAEKAAPKRGRRGAAKKADEPPADEEKADSVEDGAEADEVEAPSKPVKAVGKRGGRRGAKKADEAPAEVDEDEKVEEAALAEEEVEAPSKPERKRGGRRGAANKADEVEVDEAEHEEPSEPKAANGSNAPKKRGGKKREPEKAAEGESGQNPDPAGPDQKKAKPNETEEESYECSRENKKGEKWNLKISTWNVAGMRAWVKKNGQDYITKEDPDIICLQETKCPEAKVPAEAKIEGYHYYWANSSKDGYAGVALYTKEKPLNVTNGIGNAEHDDEGRVITAEYEKYFLVATYVPNAGQGLKTLPKRMNWDALFLDYLKSLDAKKPVILCGDLNVAHQEIDLANPKTNKKSAGFTQEERDGMTKMLSEGFVDSFRQLYPDRAQAYTFWTYMSNARAKNTGWRLDYFVLSERLMDSVCDVTIRSKVLGSDHCPVTLFIHV